MITFLDLILTVTYVFVFERKTEIISFIVTYVFWVFSYPVQFVMKQFHRKIIFVFEYWIVFPKQKKNHKSIGKKRWILLWIPVLRNYHKIVFFLSIYVFCFYVLLNSYIFCWNFFYWTPWKLLAFHPLNSNGNI